MNALHDLVVLSIGVLIGVLFAEGYKILGGAAVGWIRDRRATDVWRCRRCGRSDGRVDPHPTRYSAGPRGGARAILALCEPCFDELATPEARYPYYAAMIVELRETLTADGDGERLARLNAEVPAIVAAVRVGS